MGLVITKEEIRNKLQTAYSGEGIIACGYAVVVHNYAFWKNAFYFAGLTKTNLLLLRIGNIYRRPKGLTTIPLTEIAACAYAGVGSMLTSHVVVLITRAGVKYPLQFPFIMGLENPQVAKDIYNYLVAEKNAGRLQIDFGG
jgi:hypothetical protein